MLPLRHLFVLLFAVALVSSSCGTDGGTGGTATPGTVTTATTATTSATEPTPTTPSTTETPTPTTVTSTPTTAPPLVEQIVNVYWAGTVVNPTGTPERLLAGGRVTTDPPARAALEALLQGPNELEADIGLFTSIPVGTRLMDLNISDGVAIVDLSAEFEQSSGSLDEFFRAGQVVFTLTQFDSVDGVTFRIDGQPRDALGSHGIDVSRPVDRSDFETIRAFILPEWPYPGASFQSGDRISGESNTFEANVEWVVTDQDGLIIGEGFTTATDGNGTWGRFDTQGILDAETAGLGALIVFDTSAKDGSQINVVEYPIQLVGA